MTLIFEKNASKRCQGHINVYHSVFVEKESDILSYLDRNNANVLELMKKLEKNKQQQLSIDDSFAIAPKKRKLRQNDAFNELVTVSVMLGLGHSFFDEPIFRKWAEKYVPDWNPS